MSTTERPRFWSDGEWVWIRAPYRADFVNSIKLNVPSRDRGWDDKQRLWKVRPFHVTTIRSLLLKHYGGYQDGIENRDVGFQDRWNERENTRYYQTPPNTDWYKNWEEHARRFGAGSFNTSNPFGERGNFSAGFGATRPAGGPHAALYVTADAPKEVIDAAYRALSKLYHPDLPGGSEEKMKALNEAYGKVKK